MDYTENELIENAIKLYTERHPKRAYLIYKSKSTVNSLGYIRLKDRGGKILFKIKKENLHSEELASANEWEMNLMQHYTKLGKNKSLFEIRQERKKIPQHIAIGLLIGSLFGGCIAMVGSRGGEDDFGMYEKFDYVQARSMCSFILKEKLRDPNSLKIEDVTITNTENHLGTAAIKYQAKNGIGGMVRDTAICRKYEDKNGTVHLTVTL